MWRHRQCLLPKAGYVSRLTIRFIIPHMSVVVLVVVVVVVVSYSDEVLFSTGCVCNTVLCSSYYLVAFTL